MINQKQKVNTDYPKVKGDARRLIDEHLKFDSPSKNVIGEKLVLLQKLTGIKY